MSPRADDAWFELVPQALIEFDEQGRVLRTNASFRHLLGPRPQVGTYLSAADATVQRLTGWDAPLSLLGLTPGRAPLQTQISVEPGTREARYLRGEVHVHAAHDGSRALRFLGVVQDTAAVSLMLQQPPGQDTEPGALEPSSLAHATHRSEAGPDQLLHELSTILESSPAGTAYLRGRRVVRCNRRFERMLGFSPGSLPGQPLDTLLAGDPRIERVVIQSTVALQSTGQFETEVEIVMPGHPVRWYALSMRRIVLGASQMEVIAVLSDISRIRTQQAQLEALGRDRDLMFSLSGVGIAFVREGLIQSANPALAQLLGLPERALVGRPLAGCYATEADPQAGPEVLARLSHEGHWQGERALLHASGRALWAEVNLRLVHPQRAKEGYIASFVNVDDRHRARQSLTLQADRTRAILDSVFVGIVTLDVTGIVWMNRSARRMFGGDLEDFLGQPLSTVATPKLDHPFRLTDYLDELQDGQSHTFECEVMGRDGRVFWVVGNAVVTLGDLNERQITYALLDIDRRRQAEASTLQARETLQRIIEMAPMAITLYDARTLAVIQSNQASSAFLGIDAAQALGRPPEQVLVHDGERARLMRADLLTALDSGAPLHREYKVTRGAMTQTWDLNYLPLSHDGQTADQLLLVASDVSEQRAAEQARLEAAIAQREMLVKEVHHRIKNNLQGVAGLLQQIAARKPEVAPAISEAVGQVQAIAQVYGLQVGAGGPLHLQNVVEAIVQSVQRTFGRPIALQVQGCRCQDWQLPEAESIPIALSLNELLTNAYKHGSDGSSMSCQMICTDREVVIDIRNGGQLPEDFNLAQVRGGVAGLGLVRALLPRRSSTLSMFQEAAEVLTRIKLTAPGIHLADPPPLLGEAAGRQTTLWSQ